MYVVGVDLSINYPALCICEDFDKFEFIGIVNNPKISNVNLNYILTETAKYEDVHILDISQERHRNHIYHVDERNNILNFDRIISTIVMELRKRVTSDNVVIAMEGISYGSSGSSLIDISMLTGAFRRAMVKEVLNNNANKMFVFAPSELKNAICLKGNATKTEVLAQFLDDPGIPKAAESGMRRFMYEHVPNENGNLATSEYVYKSNKDEVCSPFNDMIDAYLSVLKIFKSVS